MDKIELLPVIIIIDEEDIDELVEAISRLETELAYPVHNLAPLSSSERKALEKHLEANGYAFASLLDAQAEEEKKVRPDPTSIRKIKIAMDKLGNIERYLERIRTSSDSY
ncbi:hypothetical protein Daesc_005643 [Daldinia eschscholtzii]|uniref:Uncharacterized protein n=1 Tax=Daldinia eschscholtzii TaxID=292717 RepID=A0AAX6ML00_9PEZI